LNGLWIDTVGYQPARLRLELGEHPGFEVDRDLVDSGELLAAPQPDRRKCRVDPRP